MNTEQMILIAEDDEADIVLLQIVLKKCGIDDQLIVTRDGDETLDYLYRRKKYRDVPAALPALVLLDLKMPKVGGLEVLTQIRSDASLKAIPVVIFTSSMSEKDKAAAQAAGANEFVVKPIIFEDYTAAVERIMRSYLGQC